MIKLRILALAVSFGALLAAAFIDIPSSHALECPVADVEHCPPPQDSWWPPHRIFPDFPVDHPASEPGSFPFKHVGGSIG